MKKILHTISKSFRLMQNFTLLLIQIIRIKYSRITKKDLVFIMGTPQHNNIGDLAINWAEINFIKSQSENISCISIPLENAFRYLPVYRRLINNKDIITGHGGGNMGDMYQIEEDWRRLMIETFPNNKILVFPQTIHYSDNSNGQIELQNSIDIYSKHQNLTLIAREKVSYNFMKEHFTENSVLLTPDIVLSSKISEPSRSRNGVLLCIRSDIESSLTSEDKDLIVDFAKNKFNNIKITDTISNSKLFNITPKILVVKNKLREFSGAEMVITDRLHGMVFAAITGTPCITLTNFNHKVKGTYQWIKDLEYIKYCESAQQIESVYLTIKLQKRYRYNPGEFSKYWDKISTSLKKTN